MEAKVNSLIKMLSDKENEQEGLFYKIVKEKIEDNRKVKVNKLLQEKLDRKLVISYHYSSTIEA